MQNLDVEEQLCALEEIIFSEHDFIVQKNQDRNVVKTVLRAGEDPKQILNFYKTLNYDALKKSQVGMFSSGTTKGSRSLCFRSKLSILEEVVEVGGHLSSLLSKRILIMVSPYHSFGLVPALLTCRRLTKDIFLSSGQAPLEVIRHLFAHKPEVIFAVPLHLRLIAEWVQKKRKSISFLKQIVYAGAVLDLQLVRFFDEQHITLTSLYGTTQTGVIAVQKKVTASNPHNCGKVLNTLSVSLSEERNEIVIVNSEGKQEFTGDQGYWIAEDLVIQNRLDAVVFYNGSKIDLKWLEMLIKNALEIEEVQIRFEKNISSQSEVICYLPKEYKELHPLFFEKIKEVVPSYAIPKRFQYG